MIPGIMISQVWPRACYTPGETEQALELALHTSRFNGFQTVQIPDSSERRNVSGLLADNNLLHTYCFTRMLGEKNLSLSSLDQQIRAKAVDEAYRGIEQARECGSARASLVSGPAPEKPNLRSSALNVLSESLELLAEEAAKEPVVELIIEPLDYKAHKKGTLGTFKEALDLVACLEGKGLIIKICADTSHMLLNGEDPVEAVKPHLDVVSEYHFCNPVLDQDRPDFGDRHRPFGAPGALDELDLNTLSANLFGSSLAERYNEIGLFLEVINQNPDDSLSAKGLLDYNVKIMNSLFGGVI